MDFKALYHKPIPKSKGIIDFYDFWIYIHFTE